uniref:Restriction endonuclease n=1 Tax=Strongyloides venezuelensis TaxID=75913 RepID=A0A0K0EU08_STRVS
MVKTLKKGQILSVISYQDTVNTIKLEIEEAFNKKGYCNNYHQQKIADLIWEPIDRYKNIIPTIFEVPSKDSPNDILKVSSKFTINVVNKAKVLLTRLGFGISLKNSDGLLGQKI